MLAYFDIFSGISGDMTLAACVDLGVPVDWLTEELRMMPLAGFQLATTDISVHGIAAKRVKVDVLAESESRNYGQIRSLILNSPLPQRVKDRSVAIFERLATAEAFIHKCPREKVHFHEIGGIDAIADIVGTALCLEFLGIGSIECSKIPMGAGFVQSRHGILPVPAPATLAILKEVPVYGTDIPFELVTPTGAAIVAALSRSFGKMADMVVHKVGYGAGSYDLGPVPNLLRIIIGKEPEERKAAPAEIETDTILVLEASIDDMNPEVLGYTAGQLFARGALDVILHPVYMKKNRPGTMLQVLCRKEQKNEMIGCILAETTSLGVRFYEVQRHLLKREKDFMETSFGRVQIKKITDPSGGVRIAPEFESCKKIAEEKQVPIQKVYDAVVKATGFSG